MAPESVNFSSLNYSLPFSSKEPSLTFSWIGFTLIATVLAFMIFKRDPYAHIPAVGGTDMISSYFTAKKFYNRFYEILSIGYAEYKGRIFRVPDQDRWNIIVSRPDQIEELIKAPDDVLSFDEFVNKEFFVKDLMGSTLIENNYHVGIIRSQLTKNLCHLFDDLREEVELAMNDNIPLTDDWTSIHAYSKIVQIIARASNRILVGWPLCRNAEYLQISIDYSASVTKGRDILLYMPACVRPFAVKFLTTVPKSIALAGKHLGPIIKERQAKIDEYGPDYPDKPFDFLSWLMDEATGEERSIPALTNRVLLVNFAAIHTSGMSFAHALYQLAAEPHYLQPMRDEIEAVIAKEGWTKVAMTKMHKLDSFFRESQRYNGSSFVSLFRLSLKDFTFSDGTLIPKGSLLSVANRPIHRDEEKYPNGDKFDGFRFARIRAEDGLNTTHQFVNTSPDYIPFGHGRHACPGRFFAATELKAIMVYLVLNYDVKMENEGVRPPNVTAVWSCMPDVTAHRRRFLTLEEKGTISTIGQGALRFLRRTKLPYLAVCVNAEKGLHDCHIGGSDVPLEEEGFEYNLIVG
ncbi:hypothetical protein Clacol_009473 [Clathrus columnatus]|uniref:Cytochrome P450 n=1 Tax=Clathrus columnatus TaxID=1419009 RepID=A0AAV5AKK4_9AGAM|nr:hypothetical protein Clacol_009473 [Clathrus columnatus]